MRAKVGEVNPDKGINAYSVGYLLENVRSLCAAFYPTRTPGTELFPVQFVDGPGGPLQPTSVVFIEGRKEQIAADKALEAAAAAALEAAAEKAIAAAPAGNLKRGALCDIL